MRVILETDNAIVGFDNQKKTLIVLWSSKGSEQEFTQVYDCILKGFKIYFVNTLINDISGFGELNSQNFNYLTKTLIPTLIKCGLRNFVSVNSVKKTNAMFGLYFKEENNDLLRKVVFKEASTFEEAFDKITA